MTHHHIQSTPECQNCSRKTNKAEKYAYYVLKRSREVLHGRINTKRDTLSTTGIMRSAATRRKWKQTKKRETRQ